MTTPLVLMILDGWGYREQSDNNAIALANTPNWDHLWQTCPHALISGSGDDVGLPSGQMGNSEVGHLNIGAGRIVPQDYTRITHAINNGEFYQHPVLLDAIARTKANNGCLHILGLLSPGGVHSHQQHIQAAITLAAQQQLHNVAVHAFLDGRDTPPQSALASLQTVEAQLQHTNVGKIASIIGRYYAMDRDNRWDRIKQAYELLTGIHTIHSADSAEAGLRAAYARGETDEFVQATQIGKGHPIRAGDSVLFMNFRADRARQLTRIFIEPTLNERDTPIIPLTTFLSLTKYADDLLTTVVYPPQVIHNCLGEYLASKQLHQLRLAETEKYAHVTFFFNGGIEQPFSLEERQLIPSPKVTTYDLQPEMSAPALTDALIAAINKKQYDMIICNYANADMVGHTGNLNAAIKAVTVLDKCIGRVLTALTAVGGELLITADHGNVEQMADSTSGQAHTAHTSEPVPFIYKGRPAHCVHQQGILADIAPTVLSLLGLAIPTEMTGQSIFKLDD